MDQIVKEMLKHPAPSLQAVTARLHDLVNKHEYITDSIHGKLREIKRRPIPVCENDPSISEDDSLVSTITTILDSFERINLKAEENLDHLKSLI